MADNKITLANTLYGILKEKNVTVATAESCTGGMIGAALTAIPGISEFYGYGVVTYANEAKEQLIGVKHETLEEFGAVSDKTACEMAAGVLKLAKSDYGIAVTGIAGPGGGSAEKPVGLVYIGFADKNGKCTAYKNIFDGDRESVREQTVCTALKILIKNIKPFRERG